MDNLVNRFKQGDVHVLEYLITEYSSNLVRFVKSYIADEGRAKDIVQEVFISVWNKRESLSADSNMKSLLYTVCKNKTLNMIRDEKQFSNSVSMSVLLEANIKSISYIQTDFLEEEDLEKLMNDLIDSLPEKYREVFLMSRMEEKTYSQISTELHITQKAVEKRMSKAFSIFRNRMKEGFCVILFFFR